MSGPSGFLTKTFEIFSTPEYADLCGWGPKGDTIYVRKIEEFSKQILPKYFKHSNFQSFVRQLNMYDFHKTVQDPNNGEFQHLYFRKDRPELMALIKRKANCRTETTKKIRPVNFSAAVKSESLVTNQDEHSSMVDPDSLYVVGQEQMIPTITAAPLSLPPPLVAPPQPPLPPRAVGRDDLEQRVRDLETSLERVGGMESQNARILGENQMLKRLMLEMRGKQLSLQDRLETVLRRLYAVYVTVYNGLSSRAVQGDSWANEQAVALSTVLTRRPSLDRAPNRERPPLPPPPPSRVSNALQKDESLDPSPLSLAPLTEEAFMELYRIKELAAAGGGNKGFSGLDIGFGLDAADLSLAIGSSGVSSSQNEMTKQSSFDAAASSVTPPFAASNTFNFYDSSPGYDSSGQGVEFLSSLDMDENDRLDRLQGVDAGSGDSLGGGALVRQAAYDHFSHPEVSRARKPAPSSHRTRKSAKSVGETPLETSQRKKQKMDSSIVVGNRDRDLGLVAAKSSQLVHQSSLSSFSRLDSLDSTLSSLLDLVSGDTPLFRQSSVNSVVSDGGPLIRLSSVLSVGDSNSFTGSSAYDKKDLLEDGDDALNTEGGDDDDNDDDDPDSL